MPIFDCFLNTFSVCSGTEKVAMKRKSRGRACMGSSGMEILEILVFQDKVLRLFGSITIAFEVESSSRIQNARNSDTSQVK
jgi:hypothetical protein